MGLLGCPVLVRGFYEFRMVIPISLLISGSMLITGRELILVFDENFSYILMGKSRTGEFLLSDDLSLPDFVLLHLFFA